MGHLAILGRMSAESTAPVEHEARSLPRLVCPQHGEQLEELGSQLACHEGCRYPIVAGVPRFVPASTYADSFGLQWNAFRTTQLDSRTGASISRDRLRRCLGGSFDAVRGKTVLEAGCGAGRFTEILLDEGAAVLAVDLSSAVEANIANCGGRPVYAVAQADLRRLPVLDQSFEVVVCLGVIQHTPDPEETIAALARYVEPRGLLVIDHYGPDYPLTMPRRLTRALALRLPLRQRMRVVLGLSRALIAVHRLTWRDRRGFRLLRFLLGKVSPLVDYYDAYPQLSRKLLEEWAILDTHDTITDYYKHRRSEEQIASALTGAGLEVVEVRHGGNGIEAIARRTA